MPLPLQFPSLKIPLRYSCDVLMYFKYFKTKKKKKKWPDNHICTFSTPDEKAKTQTAPVPQVKNLSNAFCVAHDLCQSKGKTMYLGNLIRHCFLVIHAASQHFWWAQKSSCNTRTVINTTQGWIWQEHHLDSQLLLLLPMRHLSCLLTHVTYH